MQTRCLFQNLRFLIRRHQKFRPQYPCYEETLTLVWIGCGEAQLSPTTAIKVGVLWCVWGACCCCCSPGTACICAATRSTLGSCCGGGTFGIFTITGSSALTTGIRRSQFSDSWRKTIPKQTLQRPKTRALIWVSSDLELWIWRFSVCAHLGANLDIFFFPAYQFVLCGVKSMQIVVMLSKKLNVLYTFNRLWSTKLP